MKKKKVPESARVARPNYRMAEKMVARMSRTKESPVKRNPILFALHGHTKAGAGVPFVLLTPQQQNMLCEIIMGKDWLPARSEFSKRLDPHNATTSLGYFISPKEIEDWYKLYEDTDWSPNANIIARNIGVVWDRIVFETYFCKWLLEDAAKNNPYSPNSQWFLDLSGGTGEFTPGDILNLFDQLLNEPEASISRSMPRSVLEEIVRGGFLFYAWHSVLMKLPTDFRDFILRNGATLAEQSYMFITSKMVVEMYGMSEGQIDTFCKHELKPELTKFVEKLNLKNLDLKGIQPSPEGAQLSKATAGVKPKSVSSPRTDLPPRIRDDIGETIYDNISEMTRGASHKKRVFMKDAFAILAAQSKDVLGIALEEGDIKGRYYRSRGYKQERDHKDVNYSRMDFKDLRDSEDN